MTVFQIIWFQLFQNGEYYLQRGIRERLESLDLSMGSPRTTSVELQEAMAFFGTPRPPDPVPTPEEVLEATKANQPATDDGYALFRALEQAIPSHRTTRRSRLLMTSHLPSSVVAATLGGGLSEREGTCRGNGGRPRTVLASIN